MATPTVTKPSGPVKPAEPSQLCAIAMPMDRRLMLSNGLLLLLGMAGLLGSLAILHGVVQMFRLYHYVLVLGKGNTVAIPWFSAICGWIVLTTNAWGFWLVLKTRPQANPDATGRQSAGSEETAGEDEDSEGDESPISSPRLISNPHPKGKVPGGTTEENDNRTRWTRFSWIFTLLSACLCLLLVTFVGGLVYWRWTQESRVESRLKIAFNDTFMQWPNVTEAIHMMQRSHQCCGVKGPQDFFDESHQNWVAGVLYTENFYAPFSCCNLDHSGCVRHRPKLPPKCGSNPNAECLSTGGLHKKGCAQVLADLIRSRLIWLLAPICSVTGLQMLITLLFHFYFTSSSMALDFPDDKVVGYLWGTLGPAPPKPKWRPPRPPPPQKKSPSPSEEAVEPEEPEDEDADEDVDEDELNYGEFDD